MQGLTQSTRWKRYFSKKEGIAFYYYPRPPPHGLAKDQTFSVFFSAPFPLALSLEVGNKYYHWMLKIEYRNVAIFKTTIPMHGKNRMDGSKRKKQISLNYFHVIN